MITLTDSVSALFTPATTAELEAFFNASSRIIVDGSPVNDWWISPVRNDVRALLLFNGPNPEEGPIQVAITFQLPANALIATSLPDEHALLAVSDGKVWTYGDFCMIDANAFYLAELAVSTPAYQRIAGRLKVESPEAWATWQRWPDRHDHPTSN